MFDTNTLSSRLVNYSYRPVFEIFSLFISRQFSLANIKSVQNKISYLYEDLVTFWRWCNVVLTLMQRCLDVKNVVWTLMQRCLDVSNSVTTLKQRRVLAGKYPKRFLAFKRISNSYFYDLKYPTIINQAIWNISNWLFWLDVLTR